MGRLAGLLAPAMGAGRAEGATAGPRMQYLVAEAATGRVLAQQWPQAEVAVPVGSLLKPFVAMGYGARNRFAFPEVGCDGRAAGCWLAQGHGRLGLTAAVAQSCNAYFLHLARRMGEGELRETFAAFGLRATGPLFAEAAIGLGEAQRFAPAALLAAYGQLLGARRQPGAAEVVAGMRESARAGTGKGLGPNYLCKTGTAANAKWDGDGLVMAAWPVLEPGRLALFRWPGHTGARTAEAARPILEPWRRQ